MAQIFLQLTEATRGPSGWAALVIIGSRFLTSEVRAMAVVTELGALKQLRERIEELRGYL